MKHHYPEIDVDLLNRLRAGDAVAFDEIYHRFAPRLYQRLLRLLKDTATVEELLQDVFLKLWERREQVVPEQGFKTYLYRISDHLAIDVFRKISRDKAMHEELWASAVSFYLHTEEAMIAKEQRKLVTEAIERLPPKRRRIVELCKIEERSYQEVAVIMGVSVSTVSNQLVKAMKDVKKYVLQFAEGEHAIGFFLIMTTWTA